MTGSTPADATGTAHRRAHSRSAGAAGRARGVWRSLARWSCSRASRRSGFREDGTSLRAADVALVPKRTKAPKRFTQATLRARAREERHRPAVGAISRRRRSATARSRPGTSCSRASPLRRSASSSRGPTAPACSSISAGCRGPLRLADLSGYVRSLGIAPARTFSRTFQATPMSHRGADVGHFFLPEETDGGSSRRRRRGADAVRVAGRGRHRQRWRAPQRAARPRRPLEALVETLPVGVAVFDAKNGRPVSFNREARRIVESLRMQGRRARTAPGGELLPARRRAGGLLE